MMDNSPVVVISIIGFHGGSSPVAILKRKVDDIAANGHTYWLHRSYKARPEDVRKACKSSNGPCCLFVAASGATANKPHGISRPTTTDEDAREWSIDKQEWLHFQVGQSFVSGKVKDGMAHALVFNRIEIVEGAEMVDLWGFSERNGSPLKFFPNACSICCQDAMPKNCAPKSRMRRLVAKGWFSDPFSVWLK